MKNVYILTKNHTVKNYVKSFNLNTGYMAFSAEKNKAANFSENDAQSIKNMLDRNRMFATTESVE